MVACVRLPTWSMPLVIVHITREPQTNFPPKDCVHQVLQGTVATPVSLAVLTLRAIHCPTDISARGVIVGV